MIRRILIPCVASLLGYVLLAAAVLDRPLSLGMFRQQIDAVLTRGHATDGRKIVILAGSNGPSSHRCEVMEPLLGVSCVNAGIAVGIGLDYLAALWTPLLRPGDVVYLPLEEVQYTRSRAANALGPDAAIMFRHDWSTLARLPPDRWMGAMFSLGPRAMLMSLIETSLIATGFQNPREAATGSTNAWGDRIGHTAALGQINAARLSAMKPEHETALRIRNGDGAAEVRRLIEWGRAHGVRMVGGMPAGFANAPVPEATKRAIRTLYQEAGAEFVDLGEQDLYPPAAFFDTPDHLNEETQITRSRLIAAALAPILAPAREASR